ncbi:hypothetical protein R1flu_015288 [Riccia fluitans]|uniref:Uncharacterized protein n=1 Tax=Riccia fluitans TaxID=41844 RepID=A0ABD1YIM8_9MARC
MNATSYNDDTLEKELLKRGREDSLVMGRVNKERLAQLLGEIQRKENTEDRYKAALRGETLTGTPEARIRGGGGSSVAPVVKEDNLVCKHKVQLLIVRILDVFERRGYRSNMRRMSEDVGMVTQEPIEIADVPNDHHYNELSIRLAGFKTEMSY